MASNADLVARAPLYPAPDLVAYVDAIEADLYARAGVYGAPDVVAYPWGTPVPASGAAPSTLTLTPDPGALVIGWGTAPTVTVSAPGSGLNLVWLFSLRN